MLVIVEPKKLDIKFIIETVKTRVVPCSKIYTDDFKIYRSFPKHGYIHEHIDHAGNKYVRGEIDANNIEGFWGILKRKMSCIGSMRRGHLHFFVAEIVWKYNHRGQPLEEQEQAFGAPILLK